MGLAVFIRANELKGMMKQFENNNGLMFWGSAMALVAGLAIILTHSVWDTPWQGLITLFGWIALLKGIFLAIMPKPLLRFSQALLAPGYARVCGVVMIIISLYLLGYGTGFLV